MSNVTYLLTAPRRPRGDGSEPDGDFAVLWRYYSQARSALRAGERAEAYRHVFALILFRRPGDVSGAAAEAMQRYRARCILYLSELDMQLRGLAPAPAGTPVFVGANCGAEQ